MNDTEARTAADLAVALMGGRAVFDLSTEDRHVLPHVLAAVSVRRPTWVFKIEQGADHDGLLRVVTVKPDQDKYSSWDLLRDPDEAAEQ